MAKLVEIGACYRDPLDGEIVRVVSLDRLRVSVVWTRITPNVGQEIDWHGPGPEALRRTYSERVPDPTPALSSEAALEGGITRKLVDEVNTLRSQVRRLENDLEVARMRLSAERLEEARQARIDEMARRIWAEESFRRDDEYTPYKRLAEAAYYAAAILEEAREKYIAARAEDAAARADKTQD